MDMNVDSLHKSVTVVAGDLLDQQVDAIVNTWNRNVIPWWLLLPQGVSGAIKRKAGLQPFRELARLGPIPLGGAVITSAGRLPFKAIIHVAGINLLWRASEKSIRTSVASALRVAKNESFGSIAIPAIGAGSGGFGEEESLRLIEDEIGRHRTSLKTVLVRYQRKAP
jgi:O-acetyl-ADP-ribose deacetylase (regulator of RNase III)